jgi:hypothetical protein
MQNFYERADDTQTTHNSFICVGKNIKLGFHIHHQTRPGYAQCVERLDSFDNIKGTSCKCGAVAKTQKTSSEQCTLELN